MMKQFHFLILSLALATSAYAAAASDDASKIRVINFKECVEKSKLGKQEQSSFEALKKQMEGNLAEREKTINEMAAKLEDNDYLDSVTPETETKLKREFRGLSQEYSQLQNQYLQALQQTNFKVVQKLTEVVGKASEKYAAKNQVDLVLNDEAAYFAAPSRDISPQIIAIMDEMYQNDANLREGIVPSFNDSKAK